MKTFAFQILLQGRVVIPEQLVADLRAQALKDPEDGGDVFITKCHEEHPTDDELFINTMLINALRKMARYGFGQDIAKLGQGVSARLAPAQVSVSVPDRVTRAIAMKQDAEVAVQVREVSPKQYAEAQAALAD